MKTKSKLVLGLSILSAATMASAATATFAWFTANATIGVNGKTDQIKTIQNASLRGLAVTATWTGSGLNGAFVEPYLTDTSGVARVWNGSSAVEDKAVAADRKHETMLLTLAVDANQENPSNYDGTYTIKIGATDHLRVGTAVEVATEGKIGGAVVNNQWQATTLYAEAGEGHSAGDINSKGTEVTLGTVTISNGVVSTYASQLVPTGKQASDGLYFYVSITNKGDQGTGESTEANAYGVVLVTSSDLVTA